MTIDDLILDYPKIPPINVIKEEESFDVNDRAQVFALICEILPDVCGKECNEASEKLRAAWLIELMLESDYGGISGEQEYRELAKRYVLNNFKKAKESYERFNKAISELKNG